MENELKDLWRLNTSEVELSEKTIDEIVKSKSTTLIAKIINTIKIEHIINIISFPIFLGLTLYRQTLVTSLLVVIIFVPFLIYYHKLLQKLKQAKIELNVHDYLINCFENLKAFVLHYKIACTSLVTISFFIGLNYDWHGKEKNKFEVFWESTGTEQLIFAALIIAGLLFSLAIMWVIIHLLYARKMKKLKAMIEELEN